MFLISWNIYSLKHISFDKCALNEHVCAKFPKKPKQKIYNKKHFKLLTLIDHNLSSDSLFQYENSKILSLFSEQLEVLLSCNVPNI
jgi:hypothetical protein